MPEEALALICEAVKKAGYQVGTEVVIALDVAASELYDTEREAYFFPGESRMKGKQIYRCHGGDDLLSGTPFG